MSVYKISLNQNVLEAAEERIIWTLENLPRVCVSFSGGKDSGLMLHLTANLARKRHKKISVLFIDWEAQFSCTISYISALREMYADVIDHFYWVALPLTTQNSLSQFQPEWQCWEPSGFASRRQTLSPIRAIFPFINPACPSNTSCVNLPTGFRINARRP